MRADIAAFPRRLADAVDRYSSLSFVHQPFTAVVCAGLGGSGIAGSFVQKFFADTLSIPYLVCKDYTLPVCIGPNTLVICSSHSGNTEETLSTFAQARQAGTHICCLTAGGKLLELAKQEQLDHVILPTGMMPRACYPYGIVAQIAILRAYGLISFDLRDELNQVSSLLLEFDQDIQQQASSYAHQIVGRMPELLCDDQCEPVAIRFRQQLNENSKMLCRNNAVPEQNHNEILGWNDRREDVIPVFLRHDYEIAKNTARLDFVTEHVRPLVQDLIQIKAQGHSKLTQFLYIVYLTDRVSLFLAELRGVDPQVIPSIDALKAKMATVNGGT